ncbi:putative phosphoethanolamine N-methyltransferase 3-like isoform X3 [Apostichopus japonicus]|uniref:phosphoethanolamine N-methyltransferase n=1 Tax=Stichopus japonicus TaxID=307972 RepID=A0A2G8JER6_STIJA|nr:putative phosphoethanolamine N-methyltransferase 3-like isoform X3 [Apostichopus japonicus]
MLDTNASLISQEELPEVMALLPELKGKKVLELGGGMGKRFTSQIATQSSHVTTVDFMESFIQKNRDLNKDHNNIEFITADVTKLEMEKGSFDVIFSNWLLMYLSDEEVRQLAMKMLTWLKEGGFLFFRESCLHQSGNAKRQFNPSKYRSPELYNNLFQSVSVPGTGKMPWGFDVCFSQSLQSYIKLKNNRNQICWLMEKTPRSDEGNHGFVTFQQFLDNKQYSKRGILRYEKIFGAGYVSTGGPQTTEEFVKMLDLQPGQKVLDVGCGIGGGDFYMAKTWLKPGGKLLISDYCCGEPPHSEEFKAYVKQRGYTLYTPKEYGKLIEEAGFIKVKAEDRSQQFINVLNGEKNKINSNKQEFLKDFTDEDFKYLEDGWNSKLKRVGNKDQAWGLFYAEKQN